MRYIIRADDDVAMTNSVHLAKLIGHILVFMSMPNVVIFDTLTLRDIL
jgi:hypothetical protein